MASCSCEPFKGFEGFESVSSEAYTSGVVSNVPESFDQPSGGWLQLLAVPTMGSMHTRHCLKIADRIHRLLVRELGQGLDCQRMLKELLYARDVLLVCDALKATDAPALAGHFRHAASSPDEAEPPASNRGFSASRWLNSLFGAPSGFNTPLASTRPTAQPLTTR